MKTEDIKELWILKDAIGASPDILLHEPTRHTIADFIHAAPTYHNKELQAEIERLQQCCKDFEFVLEGSRADKQSEEMLDKRESALMRALEWDKNIRKLQEKK